MSRRRPVSGSVRPTGSSSTKTSAPGGAEVISSARGPGRSRSAGRTDDAADDTADEGAARVFVGGISTGSAGRGGATEAGGALPEVPGAETGASPCGAVVVGAGVGVGGGSAGAGSG